MFNRPQTDESQPKAGLSIHEQQLAWAADGNIDALFDAFLNQRRLLKDAQMHQLLQQAIEQRALQDPEQFAEHMYRRMTSFTAVLVYKAHWLMTISLRGHDQAVDQFGKNPALSAEVLELLPHLIELQNHMLDLQQGHAATQRLRGLTRAKQLASESEKGRKRPPPKRRKVSPPPQTPFVPVNRLASLMESLNGHDHSNGQSAN